jgi:GT2 family glycosyltransferase
MPHADAVIAFVIPVRDDAERHCSRSARRGRHPHDLLWCRPAARRSAEVARDAGTRVITAGGNVATRSFGATATGAPLICSSTPTRSPGWLALPRRPPPVGSRAAYHPTAGARGCSARARHPAAEEPTEWLGAGNMVVRREAFVAARGFDESLETCEDVDLCAKVAMAGWQVRAVPGMRSVHHGDPKRLSHVFWGELWRGRDNLRGAAGPRRRARRRR